MKVTIVADTPTDELLRGTPQHWIDTLARFSTELGFDTFVVWPER